MDRSRHSITEYTNDRKTHAVINNKMLKSLGYTNYQLYEVELAKSEIQNREPNIVGFFILQYAKFRKLELYYNFFTNNFDTDKYAEMEMDIHSLYLALTEKELNDCIRSEKNQEWELLSSNECNDSFTAVACSNLFLRTCCAKHRKRDKRETGLLREELRCTEVLFM